jgi:FtsZ-interacting cell division protein ZipA
MPLSKLQLGLIVAGVLLVLGVIIFNWWQERSIRRRIDAAFRPTDDLRADDRPRVEPTLKAVDRDADVVGAVRESPHAASPNRPAQATPESSFVPPIDIIERPAAVAAAAAEPESEPAPLAAEPPPAALADVRPSGAQPDPDIESIIALQPVKPVAVGALAAGLHARVGKPVRWFGRRGDDGTWQLLAKDAPGAFVEVVACMLLADRNGAATQAQLDTFARVVADVAQKMAAAVRAPDTAAEADRADELDRLCADVDVQIGLTVVKPDPAAIPGTRLRGVAEAAGFRLGPSGRFEFLQEDTGTVEYSLQNVRSEPFTVESLRATTTPGVVFVLDVPRVGDPTRTFDRMKLAAKRMALTLNAEIVDDNRRALDDAALIAIRVQVEAAAAALKRVQIEPGSARALALFGA